MSMYFGAVEWTSHADFKLRFYGLSRTRALRVMRQPERKEEGIAPKTIAVMQPISTKMRDGKKTWTQEIWVMYQVKSRSKMNPFSGARGADKNVRIISVWRYPGISPKRNPLPEAILREIVELTRETG